MGDRGGQNQRGDMEGADVCGLEICESGADRFADESGVGGEIKKRNQG